MRKIFTEKQKAMLLALAKKVNDSGTFNYLNVGAVQTERKISLAEAKAGFARAAACDKILAIIAPTKPKAPALV